ncbi:DNA polymerase III subunit gamma/tau, partial [Pseudomonas syringae pv. actinidiae]|nr:DNA polymerase III subunit gamma/tau [Pseudomonas syringae pv. actinidiae]
MADATPVASPASTPGSWPRLTRPSKRSRLLTLGAAAVQPEAKAEPAPEIKPEPAPESQPEPKPAPVEEIDLPWNEPKAPVAEKPAEPEPEPEP